MQKISLLKRGLATLALLGLQGCNSTSQPAYPAELQLIIAQNSAKKPLSVDQMMASVRAKNKVAEVAGQQQLQLDYQGADMLPSQKQLILAQQLMTKQKLDMATLSIGACSSEEPLACVTIAHKRAKQLTTALNGQKPQVEYKPQLGVDVAVVTFERRTH